MDRGWAGALRGPRARPLAARPAVPPRAARARSRRLDGCGLDRGIDRRRDHETRPSRGCRRCSCSRSCVRGAAIPRPARSSPRRRRSSRRRPIRAGMRLWPVRAPRSHGSSGAPRRSREATRATYVREREAAWSWWLGELGVLATQERDRRGRPRDGDAEPWSLQLAGDWRGGGLPRGELATDRTRRLWPCPRPTTRKRCARPSRSCSVSAPARSRAWSRDGCGRSAHATSRAAHDARPRANVGRAHEPGSSTSSRLVADGLSQRRDRRAALPLPAHRRPPRVGDPAQARASARAARPWRPPVVSGCSKTGSARAQPRHFRRFGRAFPP